MPYLDDLDMAYNSLTAFDFDYFDQVIHSHVLLTPDNNALATLILIFALCTQNITHP